MRFAWFVGVVGTPEQYRARPQGGCSGTGAVPVPWLLALALVLGLGGRRGRWTIALLLVAQSAAAAPLITSTPYDAAAVGYAWQYDDDGLPTADGDNPLEWALSQGPEGMVVNNVTGEVYWMPMQTGAFDVTLTVTDVSGVAEQSFQVEVQDAMPATIDLNPPASGYDCVTGDLCSLDHDELIVLGGTPPVQLVSNEVYCFLLIGNTQFYALASPLPGVCTVSLTASNWVGSTQLSFDVNFSDPPEGTSQIEAVLQVDRAEGNAPLTVMFDGAHSVMPPAEEGWNLQLAAISFGDDSGAEFGEDSAVGDLMAFHTYEQPGSYQASLTLWAVNHTPMGKPIGVSDTSTQTIVVGTGDYQPPLTRLIVDPVDAGPAPLTTVFTSETSLGDGSIVHYLLDYGDGDQFEPVLSPGSGFVDPSTTHVYASPGQYQVRLRVTAQVELPTGDIEELVGTAEHMVVVTDDGRAPPYAYGHAVPARGEVPLDTTFAGESGDMDGLVLSRYWLMPGGVPSFDERPSMTLTEAGERVVQFVVTDNDGLETTARVVVRATQNGVLPPRIVSVPQRRATVGVPYAYDADGTATAIGGPPYVWSVGKSIGGEQVNRPAGMTIDPRTGTMTWTPTAGQAGEVKVSLLVENAAGLDLQDFIINLEAPPTAGPAGAVASDGCACSAALAPSLALPPGLLLLRRRRRGSRS